MQPVILTRAVSELFKLIWGDSSVKINLEYRLVKKINTTINKLILDAISSEYVTIHDIKEIYPFIYDQHLFSAIENLTNAGLLEIDVICKKVSLSENFAFIQSKSNSTTSIRISDSNLKFLEENYNEDMKYIFLSLFMILNSMQSLERFYKISIL